MMCVCVVCVCVRERCNFVTTQKNIGVEEQLKKLLEYTKDYDRIKEVRECSCVCVVCVWTWYDFVM